MLDGGNDGAASEQYFFEVHQQFLARLRDAGSIHVGGTALSGPGCERGWFVAPTVATIGHEDPLWRNELFVPLVLVGEIDSIDEGIERANDSDYGLTAGFYGARDEIDHFLARIEAGVTYVNRPQGATTGAWPGINPFGGWKASGSSGRGTGGPYYVQQFMREQSRVLIE